MVGGDFKHLSICLPNVASACVKMSMLTVSDVFNFNSFLFEVKQNKDYGLLGLRVVFRVTENP